MPGFAFSYTLRLSEADLQERIDLVLPVERKQLFVTVRVSDPDVDLSSRSNLVGIALSVEASVPGGLKGSGRGKLFGSVRYERNEGAFYLDEPKLRELEIKRVPAQLNKEIAKIAEVALVKALQRYPLYRLNESDNKQKMAKAMLESVNVEDQQLLIKLKPSFQ